MIVDTSALIAIILVEPGADQLRNAILQAATIVIPAPALTEMWLVTGGRADDYRELAQHFIAALIANGAVIAPFESHHAEITSSARDDFGKGNGRGGTLNFGDLMVYAIAKHSGLPLLCTGNDFSQTDLVIHPASRLDTRE